MYELEFFLMYQSLKKETNFITPDLLSNLISKHDFTDQQIGQLRRLFNKETFKYIFDLLEARNAIAKMSF